MKTTKRGRHVGTRARLRVPRLVRVPAPPSLFPALAPLPAGHMAQRPYDAVVLNLGPARAGHHPACRCEDVVTVTDADSPHHGKTGRVSAVCGTQLPYLVLFDDFTAAYFDAWQLELVEPAPLADTREMDAYLEDAYLGEFELDEMPLMGGVR